MTSVQPSSPPMQAPPFPDLADFRDKKVLAQLGYPAFAVSAFDHWLTEEEAVADTTLFAYAEALEEGRIGEFIKIESKFVALYSQLAIGGVSLVRAHGYLEALKPGGRRFRELVIANVRERLRRGRLMDVYFHHWDTRVIGHWDLTDWFCCRSPEKIDGLRDLVRESGLHVLTSEEGQNEP